VALVADSLSMAEASQWVARPDCGAVVVFSGFVRDHSEGRPGVSELEYEAYSEQVEPRLGALATEARQRWPALGRVLLWHRSGRLSVGEVSVVVAISAPHRDDAFEAARWAIDALKATMPIWKRERWEGGEGWGTGAQDIAGVTS
ncbi:MAG: molybdenum cofactor biosynthesis protein MoaE, partial [Acidimicrobiales bacterium]